MNVDTFLEQFGHLADAPDGIKKLRELILDLAVRGKLVEQDPDDEPASELLLRIEKEFQALENEKKIPKVDHQKIKREGKLLFEIPSGWIQCSLYQIIRISSGNNLPSKKMKKGKIPVYGGNGITGFHDECNVEPQTIVIGRVGFYCGSVHVTNSNAWVTDNAFIVTYSRANMNNQFLYWLLKTTDLQKNNSATAQPVISGKKIYPLNIPIPPLAEQKRIVAKVDELMALCDELETQQQQRQTVHAQLTTASLHQLTTAETPRQLTKAWQRIDTQFEQLFTTRESIEKLRQTILQLAVQGKLVEHDPEDEPAEKLLEKVRIQRLKMIESGNVTKRKSVEPVDNNNQPPLVSDLWHWAKFDEIADIIGGVTKGRKLEGKETKDYPYLRVANVQAGFLDLAVIKEIELPVKELPKYRLEPGDVLLTEGGDWDKLGRSAIWNGEIKDCVYQNHIFRARCFHNGIKPEWLRLYTNSPVGREYFQNASKKTTNLASINMTQLRNCPIPVPPTKQQDRILSRVQQLMGLCDQLEQDLIIQESTAVYLAASMTTKMLTSTTNRS